MINPVLRATAIEKILQSERGSAGLAIAEGVVSCCEELVRISEAPLALSLAERSLSAVQAEGEIWTFRLDMVSAQALMVLGRYEEAYNKCREWTPPRLASLPPDSDALLLFRMTEANSLRFLNHLHEGISGLESVRADLLRRPDSALLARCSVLLSSAEMRRGEYERARRYALDGVVSARRAGDQFWESVALNNFGQIERAHARWGSAEDSCSEAMRIAEAAGNRFEASHARRSLAIVFWKQGRLDSAETLAVECIREAAAVSAGAAEWYASLLQGLIRLHRGDYAGATSLFTRKDAWEVPRSESRPSLLTTEFLGDVGLEQNQATKALGFYERVWPEALALVPKGDIVAELRRRRAECYYLLGCFDEAYTEVRIGLEHCRELGDRYEEAATYRVLGMAAAAVGKPAEAKRWFDQGFAYYDDIETPYEWGKLWMAYGDWLKGPHAGEFADVRGALEAYHAARAQFERMGAMGKLAEADARIAGMAESRQSAAARQDEAPPPRKPRASTELDRRSAWASETFGFVTRNRAVLDLLTEVGKLASAGSPMLILGESGTGKELVAHGFHKLSGRSGEFLPINCSSLPRDVIESELFGHVTGAFTGATRDKPGLLETCHKGTAFLDEIGEMSIELQSRLLRFLETGETRRVGSNRTVEVDTLVVAATNRERAALERGDGFRPDLYYRLAHAVVVLPPLRRRGEDVDLLAMHFLEQACRAHGKSVTLTNAARNRLAAYAWPGNVRQLNAVIRRLVILSPPDHAIRAEEIQLDETGVAGSLIEELELAERQRIAEALAQAKGSRSDAARALGMARTTFLTKMKRYGIH